MDIQSSFYHQFESNKQDWAIDYWLRHHGVKSSDFDNHPCIDDMITLLNIRSALWDCMTQCERNTWGAYWGIVFRKQHPLNRKFWRKFQIIATNIDQRQIKQQQQRQLIRTLKNKDHNNDGKGSDLSQMLTDKGNNRGAAMSLLPWE